MTKTIAGWLIGEIIIARAYPAMTTLCSPNPAPRDPLQSIAAMYTPGAKVKLERIDPTAVRIP